MQQWVHGGEGVFTKEGSNDTNRLSVEFLFIRK